MKRILTALLLLAASAPAADAAFVSFTTVADGRVLDSNGDGVFDQVNTATGSSGLSIRNFVDPSFPASQRFEERSVAEFNLSSLTPGSTLSSVAFRFNEVGFANSNTRVDIYGYVGNGQVSLSDATASGVLLGSYDPVALGLGQHDVALNLSSFTALLGTSQSIGLRFQGIFGTNTQLDSLASSSGGSGIAPTIIVNASSVPEPASALLAGVGLAMLVGGLRRSRGRIG